MFNCCTNSQALRKWPLGGSLKWHTNIYYGHKHFCKHIHADWARKIQCSVRIINSPASLARSSTSQLGSGLLRWLISARSSALSHHPENSLYWWVQVKICPHIGHVEADAGQRLYSSSPISFDAHYSSHSSALSRMVCPKGLAQEAWLFSIGVSHFLYVGYIHSFLPVHMGACALCMTCLVNAS